MITGREITYSKFSDGSPEDVFELSNVSVPEQVGLGELLVRIKVSDTPVYAHPVIAGNRIYIKGKETLTMWAIE